MTQLELDDYLQAQDRIHRLSQTRTCFIYNLIAKETVDEWVEELLVAKHSLLNSLSEMSTSPSTESSHVLFR